MPLPYVDFNRLLIFRAIVQSGSLSKAALLLRQQKSRISRQLTSLEKEVGTRLFYRTTRHLKLTSAGEALFKNALPHLNGIENALEHVSDGTEEISGRIKITVPEDIGTQLMGNICYTFLTMYPKVLLDVHVSNETMDLVRESFDIALRMGRLKDSSLLQKEIGILKPGLYIAPQLYAKYGTVSSPEKLGKIPYLAFSQTDESLRLHKTKETRVVKFNPVFSSNSFFVLRELAIKGVGFTTLPPFLAEDAVARGQLVSALRGWSLEGIPIHIVFPNQKEIPARTRKFIDHLRNAFTSFASNTLILFNLIKTACLR